MILVTRIVQASMFLVAFWSVLMLVRSETALRFSHVDELARRRAQRD